MQQRGEKEDKDWPDHAMKGQMPGHTDDDYREHHPRQRSRDGEGDGDEAVDSVNSVRMSQSFPDAGRSGGDPQSPGQTQQAAASTASAFTDSTQMVGTAEVARLFEWLESIKMGKYSINFVRSGVMQLSLAEILTERDLVNNLQIPTEDSRKIIGSLRLLSNRILSLSETLGGGEEEGQRRERVQTALREKHDDAYYLLTSPSLARALGGSPQPRSRGRGNSSSPDSAPLQVDVDVDVGPLPGEECLECSSPELHSPALTRESSGPDLAANVFYVSSPSLLGSHSSQVQPPSPTRDVVSPPPPPVAIQPSSPLPEHVQMAPLQLNHGSPTLSTIPSTASSPAPGFSENLTIASVVRGALEEGHHQSFFLVWAKCLKLAGLPCACAPGGQNIHRPHPKSWMHRAWRASQLLEFHMHLYFATYDTASLLHAAEEDSSTGQSQQQEFLLKAGIEMFNFSIPLLQTYVDRVCANRSDFSELRFSKDYIRFVGLASVSAEQLPWTSPVYEEVFQRPWREAAKVRVVSFLKLIGIAEEDTLVKLSPAKAKPQQQTQGGASTEGNDSVGALTGRLCTNTSSAEKPLISCKFAPVSRTEASSSLPFPSFRVAPPPPVTISRVPLDSVDRAYIPTPLKLRKTVSAPASTINKLEVRPVSAPKSMSRPVVSNKLVRSASTSRALAVALFTPTIRRTPLKLRSGRPDQLRTDIRTPSTVDSKSTYGVLSPETSMPSTPVIRRITPAKVRRPSYPATPDVDAGAEAVALTPSDTLKFSPDAPPPPAIAVVSSAETPSAQKRRPLMLKKRTIISSPSATAVVAVSPTTALDAPSAPEGAPETATATAQTVSGDSNPIEITTNDAAPVMVQEPVVPRSEPSPNSALATDCLPGIAISEPTISDTSDFSPGAADPIQSVSVPVVSSTENVAAEPEAIYSTLADVSGILPTRDGLDDLAGPDVTVEPKVENEVDPREDISGAAEPEFRRDQAPLLTELQEAPQAIESTSLVTPAPDLGAASDNAKSRKARRRAEQRNQASLDRAAKAEAAAVAREVSIGLLQQQLKRSMVSSVVTTNTAIKDHSGTGKPLCGDVAAEIEAEVRAEVEIPGDIEAPAPVISAETEQCTPGKFSPVVPKLDLSGLR